jgi:hypothetical protein
MDALRMSLCGVMRDFHGSEPIEDKEKRLNRICRGIGVFKI